MSETTQENGLIAVRSRGDFALCDHKDVKGIDLVRSSEVVTVDGIDYPLMEGVSYMDKRRAADLVNCLPYLYVKDHLKPKGDALEGLPMTELLRQCYLASEALGADPDDERLARYERVMAELDRREGVVKRIEVETELGTLVASTELSYDDSKVVEVSLERPDGTSGQVAMVEVTSGALANEDMSPLHTFCWDGHSEEYCACVDVDPAGEAMWEYAAPELGDLVTGRWRLHLVMPGERYGRDGALTYGPEESGGAGRGLPLVEFYDVSHDPRRFPGGQFVTRYFMSTLLDGGALREASAAGEPFALDLGVPAWSVEGEDLARAVDWLDAAARALGADGNRDLSARAGDPTCVRESRGREDTFEPER